MNYFFPAAQSVNGKLQSQLMRIAALFLFLISVTLTLSRAVKFQSWRTPLPFFHWAGFFIWLIVFSWIYFVAQKYLPALDPYLLPVISLLSGWGIITIWRLNESYGLKQSLWLLVAGLLFYAGARYTAFLSLLRKYKYVWLTFGLFLTGLTFFFGTYPGGEGPNLWLNFGGVYLQPSEPLKLLLVIYLSSYFADRAPIRLTAFRLLAPTTILIAAAIFLLLAQRDLGTALVLIILYFIMTYAASANGWLLVISGFFITLAGILGYQTFDVIQQRFYTWINLWSDPMGNSYQVIQSLIATSSGGVLGRGLGLGYPGVVPISHSDFIFTSIAEEFGLVGSLGLILLYIFLILRAVKISLLAPNNNRRFLALGLSAYFAIQGFFIIAGNLNLIPLSGITLPFVSYGGSSLLASFAAALILIIISNRMDEETTIKLQPKPFLVLGGFFLAIWLLLALTNGYWVLARGEELLNRTDNPRLALDDRFVPRGSFVDRNNRPITRTTGDRGSFGVEIIQPELSHVIGYSDLFFGQAGLQESMDMYLRGRQGNPSSRVWTNYLFDAQRPPGLDIRLSLDIELQQMADDMLGNTIGSVILINADSGEILTMASHPYYNANELSENWEEWNNDEDAPFLNRAAQGFYDPGTAFSPFILYQYIRDTPLPAVPLNMSINLQDEIISCVKAPANTSEWGAVIASGCPGPILALVNTLPIQELIDISSRLGFDATPIISVPAAQPDNLESIEFSQNAVLGFTPLRISPLQMALAAAMITNNGTRPDPSLVLAVNTPHQGWIILPQNAPVSPLNSAVVGQVREMLSVPGTFFWQSLGSTIDEEKGSFTWFIGGTTEKWQGSPLAIVVMLEQDDPDLAINIGQAMLEKTTSSRD